jgi:hypothetical protein
MEGWLVCAHALRLLSPRCSSARRCLTLGTAPPPHAPTPDKPVVVPGVHRPHLKVHGFGLEGEAATEEVLLLAVRERPTSTELIMAGQRTQVGRGGGGIGQCIAGCSDYVPAHDADMQAPTISL